MNASPDTSSPAVSRPPSFWIKLPAILAIVFCLVLGGSFLAWNPERVSSRYRAIAQKAVDEKDFPTALVAAGRLLSFGGESRNEALFLLVQANLGAGHNAEAAGILQMIAPLNRPVFAPAHLFVARTLMARPNRSTQMDRAIETQLGNTLTLHPDSAEAKELLARLRGVEE